MTMMKSFEELSENEVLTLAVSDEEEDGRVYLNLACRLHEQYPGSAKPFQEKEMETAHFYRQTAEQSHDVSVPKLLTRLVDAKDARVREDETARRLFVLQYVQPGLAGLMDGSVSTLAPLFAAAFATHNSWESFLVGLAASVGAGISMSFAEALSDDGSLTGRGAPVLRGMICGLMTFLGGIGHTLPYLIPSFMVATVASFAVVAIELALISYVRCRYMDTPLLKTAFQVVVGGALVFAAGIFIGNA
jgi:rubrerythrin